MNKLMKMVVVSCAMAGFAIAAQAQYGNSQEYQEMEMWLFESYVKGLNEYDNTEKYYTQKDAYYAFIDGIRDKIRQELPVDPQLLSQVEAIKAAGARAQADKLAELGLASESQLFEYCKNKYGENKDLIYGSEEYTAYTAIAQQTTLAVNNAMKVYNDELQSRFEAAFIQAVKKYQENAAAR